MDVDLAAIMRVIGGKSSSRGYLKHVPVIFKTLLCNYNMYALIENADNRDVWKCVKGYQREVKQFWYTQKKSRKLRNCLITAKYMHIDIILFKEYLRFLFMRILLFMRIIERYRKFL